MKAPLASLLVLLLGAYLALSGEWTPLTPTLGTLAAVSVYLQLMAVPQCGFGFFSSAFASLFAMILTAGIGPRWTLLAALLGSGLRTVTKGNPHPAVRWREALADGLPTLAALAAAWAGQQWAPQTPLASIAAGLAVFLPLSMIVPEWVALESPGVQGELWYHLREMTGYHSFAVAFLGPVTAYLIRAGDWWCVSWLLPVFFALHRASRTDLLRLEAIERELLQQQAERTEEALHSTAAQLAQTSQALQTQLSGRQLGEQLTHRLAACTAPQEVLELMLDCLKSSVPARSVVFYALEQAGLIPVRWLSPSGERLAQAASRQDAEPLVVLSWQAGQMEPGGSASQICPEEAITLAAPVAGEGVLYLGRHQPPWLPVELELVQVVASQGALALQSVRRFGSQQQALEMHRQAHQQLQIWVQRLGYLLEASRVLGSTQDQETLLERFQQLLEGLIPQTQGAILAEDRVLLSWPQSVEFGPALGTLRQAVSQPLLLEDFDQTRFAPPWPAARSLLAIPLADEDGTWGCLLLASSQPGFFDRQHQDLIVLVSAQLTSAMRGSTLREQVRSSQAQLSQSSKMAAVGQLAAGIAHEINTPLAAVTLQLDSALMRLEKRPELVREKLEVAQKAIEKVQSIIAKLLYYSRDAAVGRQAVDLNLVVRDTLELIACQVEIDGVRLETRLAEVPSVMANANELQQVLTNLLLNARDAALQSPSRVIRLETSQHQGQVVLLVEDQGPGIAAEIQSRIFEPFFTTKEVGRGTGLGLSVSLDMIRNHGGRIEVQSVPGKTRFVVYLPPITA